MVGVRVMVNRWSTEKGMIGSSARAGDERVGGGKGRERSELRRMVRISGYRERRIH